MSIAASRSAETVKEEMPASYLVPTAARIESNSAVWVVEVTPRTAAMALARSTS